MWGISRLWYTPESNTSKSNLDRSSSGSENPIMRKVCAAVFLLGGLAWPQSTPVSQPSLRVFVQQARGFDLYISAAFEKKHVPVSVVLDKAQADIEVAATRFGDETDVKVTSVQSGDMVYEWSAIGKSERRMEKAAAEACADRLNRVIAARKYPRKSKLSTALQRDPAFDF
jgi:hypothetical protein